MDEVVSEVGISGKPDTGEIAIIDQATFDNVLGLHSIGAVFAHDELAIVGTAVEVGLRGGVPDAEAEFAARPEPPADTRPEPDLDRGTPTPAPAVAGGVAAVAAFGLQQHGVAVTGTVPAGLPQLHLAWLDGATYRSLLQDAAGIVLISFASGVLTAKSFARRNSNTMPTNAMSNIRSAPTSRGTAMIKVSRCRPAEASLMLVAITLSH